MVRVDVLLGIGDDAAILRVPSGCDLVISTDTLNAGVHFPHDTTPFDIGWKALAVNLSDLAAMGAQPAWCTLNLSLPEADAAWVDAFLDGFLALATAHDVALVGGDTTRGPLSITVTVHGFVPHDAALRRDHAVVGDDVWVSGTLGDAAAGLALWVAGAHPSPGADAPPSPARGEGQQSAPDVMAATLQSPSPLAGEGLGRGGDEASKLLVRLHRPTPRIVLGLALRGIAHACIDVSDGLLADLRHVLDESRVGATIDPALLPTSPELAAAFDEATRARFQLGGGDDYELCFTAPADRVDEVLAAARTAGVPVTRIGRIDAECGLRLRDSEGVLIDAPALGYRHFDPACDPASDKAGEA
ncbi:MAG: thiamine-phosphate kinase [Proteobacteria bacterium]|nr:thiamine-phosphate kinase [Pseudomonadota bacterium]